MCHFVTNFKTLRLKSLPNSLVSRRFYLLSGKEQGGREKGLLFG